MEEPDPATALVASVEQLPADAMQTMEFGKARHFMGMAKLTAAQSVAYMAMCGLELAQLHKKYGTTKGKHTQGGQMPWGERVKVEMGISESTAWRYMEIAKAARKNVDALRTLPLDCPISELEAEQTELLLESVQAVTDGQSATEIMQEWGIAKRPRGHGLQKSKRKYHPTKADGTPRAPKRTAAEIERDKARAQWVTKKGEDGPLRATLLDWLTESRFAHLEDDELTELAEILHDLKQGVTQLQNARSGSQGVPPCPQPQSAPSAHSQPLAPNYTPPKDSDYELPQDDDSVPPTHATAGGEEASLTPDTSPLTPDYDAALLEESANLLATD